MAESTESKNNYCVYSIASYSSANASFIQNNGINLTKTKLINLLKKENKSYHFRIHSNTKYIFFGDIDNYDGEIHTYINTLQQFLDTYYQLSFRADEFKYTQNDKKTGSYHFSIPKWNLKTEKLREIFTNFKKYIKDENTGINTKSIDTTIYSEHWFRCPNQTKGTNEPSDGIHVIISGTMEDFIVDYIPKKSISIDSKEYQKSTENNLQITNTCSAPFCEKADSTVNYVSNSNGDIEQYNTSSIKPKKTGIEVINEELMLSNVLSRSNTCKKMFDDCYKQDRFDTYEYWISVGMALKNTFKNEHEAFELFNYYSSKGNNYEGYEKTKYKYGSFVRSNSDGFTIATIYYYAMEDNKPKFIEIMNKNTMDLGQTDICKFLKLIAGYKFIYKCNGDSYKLYCYNGKYWERNDVLLRNCLSTELYDFLRTILVEVYWNTKDFIQLKHKIDKLKSISFKREIIETYKEYGLDNNIMFDDKWHLLGFNNMVYDMETCTFRDYKYDDYIATTTGYDWREPTDEELETMNKLIESIMPIPEERETYLQILSTGLDGRCLEKFIIFNGKGGNGKGMINDIMLLALGDYAMIGNNGILFETSKTGSNPEKANIHKKRFVVFREPPEKHKFENSTVKELTGGGSFSARGLYESNANKELNLTMVVECNKRPLFREEPGDAEIRRIVDIQFRSSFVSDDNLLDDNCYIYRANPTYKTRAFQDKHKYALMKILMSAHIRYYKNNNCILKLPQSIIDRGRQYLEMSCNIVEWFKENYEETHDLTQYVQIKDVYDLFKTSEFYSNLSKADRAKYTKKYISEYISENIFFRRYYMDRYNNVRSVIKGWTCKQIE
jgi:hypothetical protein